MRRKSSQGVSRSSGNPDACGRQQRCRALRVHPAVLSCSAEPGQLDFCPQLSAPASAPGRTCSSRSARSPTPMPGQCRSQKRCSITQTPQQKSTSLAGSGAAQCVQVALVSAYSSGLMSNNGAAACQGALPAGSRRTRRSARGATVAYREWGGMWGPSGRARPPAAQRAQGGHNLTQLPPTRTYASAQLRGRRRFTWRVRHKYRLLRRPRLHPPRPHGGGPGALRSPRGPVQQPAVGGQHVERWEEQQVQGAAEQRRSSGRPGLAHGML